jgi:hypothetical protein
MFVFVCVLGIYNCDEVIYDIKEVLLPPMTTKKNIEKKIARDSFVLVADLKQYSLIDKNLL